MTTIQDLNVGTAEVMPRPGNNKCVILKLQDGTPFIVNPNDPLSNYVLNAGDIISYKKTEQDIEFDTTTLELINRNDLEFSNVKVLKSGKSTKFVLQPVDNVPGLKSEYVISAGTLTFETREGHSLIADVVGTTLKNIRPANPVIAVVYVKDAIVNIGLINYDQEIVNGQVLENKKLSRSLRKDFDDCVEATVRLYNVNTFSLTPTTVTV